LREEFEPYSADFALENGVLSPINSCLSCIPEHRNE